MVYLTVYSLNKKKMITEVPLFRLSVSFSTIVYKMCFIPVCLWKMRSCGTIDSFGNILLKLCNAYHLIIIIRLIKGKKCITIFSIYF